MKWYRKAAEQGDARAQKSLDWCHLHRVDVPQQEQVVAAVKGVADQIDYVRRWASYRMAYDKVEELVAEETKRQGELLYVELLRYGKSPAEAWAIASPLMSGEPSSVGVATALAIATAPLPKPSVTPFSQAPRAPTPTPEIAEGKGCAGTGFFVTEDGYFVTCEHVVRGASSFHIRLPSGSLPARLIKKDRTIDVAVLKVEGAFRALPVAAQPRVKLGEAVFTVGFPNPGLQGVEPKLTRGEISSMAGARDNPRYFQISVPVQPGNSGGALLDECGNAVGVVTSRLDDVATYEASGALPQNVNYAVKGGLVYNFLSGVPGLSGKLQGARTGRDWEAASGAAERAAVLVVAE